MPGKKKTPSNFVVFLEAQAYNADDADETQGFQALRILSEDHKDTAAATSWLKKNLADIREEHGEDATYRIGNLQPPIKATIKMVPKLTIG